MSSPTGWKTWPILRDSIEIAAAFAGDRPTRRRHRAAMQQRRDFRSQLSCIERCGQLQRTSTEEPVFILSAGWRSGSTMLQRMLMDKGQIMIWGEPYDHSDILGSLKNQWLAFTEEWPAEAFFFTGETEDLARQWVANLYPTLQDLYDAHAAFLTRLFREPAQRAGFGRWGVKEVRWTVDDAHYLRWIFPRARFLFLCRNPQMAWRSYRDSRCWYLRWPEEPVFTPYRFGRFWARMVQDFQEHHAEVEGPLLRYEDLLANQDFSETESYLGLKIATPEEIGRVRSRVSMKEPVRVPAIERWLLMRGLGNAAALLGYGES